MKPLMQTAGATPAVAEAGRPNGLAAVTEAQKAHVRESFARVVPIADDAARLFYDRLFEIDPALRPLFRGDLSRQGRKLMAALTAAVASLDAPARLEPVIAELGRRHKGYGVSDADYDTVGAALIWTLARGLGPAFTDEVEEAWTAVYGALAGVMISAAAEG